MKNKIFVTIGSTLFIFCFVIFYKGLQKPNIYEPLLEGEINLPNFTSYDFFSNEKILSEELIKEGSYYIINVWASWCVPCRSEHNFLMSLKSKNFQLIGINYKDNKNNAQVFLQELGNPYSKILSDKNGTLSIELGAYGVPETLIINKNKKIIKKIIGPINDQNFSELLKIIK